MINYLKGKITYIKDEYLVVENNGIGYAVKTGNTYGYELNSEIQIYTYLHVREDLMELYGFKTIKEKEIFLKLISVKGIGPKSALAIIASGQIEKLISAISTGDSKYLQRFPGVGPKASQQIILDLHGKININEMNLNEEHPKVNTIKEALKTMGYNNSEIKLIIPEIIANIDQPENELLKIVLKKLI